MGGVGTRNGWREQNPGSGRELRLRRAGGAPSGEHKVVDDVARCQHSVK